MRSSARRLFGLFLLLFAALSAETLRFGVIGDSGTGGSGQRAVARQMEVHHRKHPWKFVLMLGDNIYPDGHPQYFARKFKNVYRNLMEAGVEFHASLGNHDRRHRLSRNGLAQVEDDAFGYIGRKDEYVYVPLPKSDGKALARLISLNSEAWIDDLARGRLPEARIAQLEQWLKDSDRYIWNIVFFHHPIYSLVSKFWPFVHPHGPAERFRDVLEPLLVNGKVDVVLSGHEHFYQKIRPQRGIHYFISGGGALVRRGVAKNHPQVEAAAERLHFMDFELTETQLNYTAIAPGGVQIHAGAIAR